jgi:uroporphyrinogen-III synthase
VRGDGGRDWLAERLRAEQAVVDFVSVYRRTVPQPDGAQSVCLQSALAEPARTQWLFSSSQAVSHLQQLAPHATWAQARAWATHPRIAQTLQALGFGHVHTVAPTIDAVVAAWVRSLQSTAVSDQRP